MTSLWRHLWPNYDTLNFKILTQCVKLLGEREYCKFGGDICIGLEDIGRKREGGLEIAPLVGRGLNWEDNYPTVNQNGLSDRILPLVKVKCVLKTTDRASPLRVNSLYGSKHHCTPMNFFSLLPAKIYQRRPSNWTPKRVVLPIMIIEPTCMVEG